MKTIALLILVCLGCDDVFVVAEFATPGWVRPASSALPPCADDVRPDHYCNNLQKVACWQSAAPYAGASGCSVVIRDTAETPSYAAECVPSCLEPSHPAPVANCPPVQRSLSCYTFDERFLQVNECQSSDGQGLDCVAASSLPPHVARCVPSCAESTP